MITDVCKPVPNGYMGQVDCAEHGTPWPCEVTEENWAEYVKAMVKQMAEAVAAVRADFGLANAGDGA